MICTNFLEDKTDITIFITKIETLNSLTMEKKSCILTVTCVNWRGWEVTVYTGAVTAVE